MKSASSLARNAAAFAMSIGRESRPSGIVLITFARASRCVLATRKKIRDQDRSLPSPD